MNTTNNDFHMKEHAGAQKHNTPRWSSPKPLTNEARKKQAKTSDKTTILAKKQMYSLHQQTYSTY